jgi:hypothetical protein
MNLARRLRQMRRSRLGPELAALSLAMPVIAENAVAGTFVSAILGASSGSALVLVDDAGGRFVLSGLTLIAGAIATDHETAASHALTIRETLAGHINSPRDTTVIVAVLDAAEGGATYLTTDDGERLTDDRSHPLILEAA